MCQATRDWVERQSEVPWSYTRVVTSIAQRERTHDSCHVRRGSLGAECKLGVLPL